jgi:hypothetical protein
MKKILLVVALTLASCSSIHYTNKGPVMAPGCPVHAGADIMVACIATPTPTPTATPTATPTSTPTPTPTPTSTPLAMHMLDNTGCEDYAPNTQFNIDNSNAPVDPNSAAMIAQSVTAVKNSPANGYDNDGTYSYGVVPTSQPLISVGGNGRGGGSHPGTFPIPSWGTTLLHGGDNPMELVEKTGPGVKCSFWGGYQFALSNGKWIGYSGGGPSDSSGQMVNYPEYPGANATQPCNGVSGNCDMTLGTALTDYEADNGSPTNPILHVIHLETPSQMTCDLGSNNCVKSGHGAGNFGIIRLKRIPETGAYTCPTDVHAAALCLALQRFGGTVDDNGCCFGINTITEDPADGSNTNQSLTGPVDTFIKTITTWQVLQSSWEVIDPTWSSVPY